MSTPEKAPIIDLTEDFQFTQPETVPVSPTSAEVGDTIEIPIGSQGEIAHGVVTEIKESRKRPMPFGPGKSRVKRYNLGSWDHEKLLKYTEEIIEQITIVHYLAIYGGTEQKKFQDEFFALCDMIID